MTNNYRILGYSQENLSDTQREIFNHLDQLCKQMLMGICKITEHYQTPPDDDYSLFGNQINANLLIGLTMKVAEALVFNVLVNCETSAPEINISRALEKLGEFTERFNEENDENVQGLLIEVLKEFQSKKASHER